MEITAVIVARGGSVRVPRKALQKFAGSTLLGHKIQVLQQVSQVGQIVVGSDSEEILDVAYGMGATGLRRSPEFCDEKSRTPNDMIRDMTERVSGDFVLWAHCTNPLVLPETYQRAIEEFLGAEGRDSLVSVEVQKGHFWRDSKPLNFSVGGEWELASNLKSVEKQNGAIFIRSRGDFAERPSFVGEAPVLFPMAWWEGWDVDTVDDLRAARALLPLFGVNPNA